MPVSHQSEVVRTGLIGEGILASRSPWLHETEAAAQGMRLVYSLFDFNDRGWSHDHLPELIEELQAAGFAGANITFPFKQAIMPLLTEISDEAAAIGAVNTVAFRNGRSIGYNTDMAGFTCGMREGLPDVRLDRVLQLGCGGAGAAVAHALLASLDTGVLVLHDVDTGRCEQLAARLARRFGADRIATTHDPQREAPGCDGIVNATPVGMAKFPGLPLSAAALVPRHWVCDIVYFPLETALLKEARERGCATLDGSRMVVHQAAEAFRIMTGHVADTSRMQRSFAGYKSPEGQQS